MTLFFQIFVRKKIVGYRNLATGDKNDGDAVFQKLASIADVASLTKQERLAYDENLRKYRDTIAVMEGQYLEGMEKGRAEGRAEGLLATARKMKADGLSTELIAKYTGLSEQDITVL